MPRLLVLHGPDLEPLAAQEPNNQGPRTLAELDLACIEWGRQLGADVETVQTNHEDGMLEVIRDTGCDFDGMVLSPGELVYTSHALADAIAGCGLATVELHLPSIGDRQPSGASGVIEPVAVYRIFGRGVEGYRWALAHLVHRAAMPFATAAYGKHVDQVGDVRLPPGKGPHPIAMLIHGGYWRDVWTRDLMDGLAVDLTRRGFATWNVEYRRIPPLGAWRATMGDAVIALDHLGEMAASADIDPRSVTVVGHSAGGHLAILAAARSQRITPRRVVSLAGVLDLAAVYDPDDPQNGPHRFLGDEGAAAFPAASPIEQVPVGVPQLIVHGSEDDSVPPAVSRAYARRAIESGDVIETLWLEGTDHMELIDPASDVWQQIAGRL